MTVQNNETSNFKMKQNVKYNIPNVQNNQKAVRIKKGISDTNHYYSKFNIEYLMYAIINLSSNGFKMWCILNKNKDGYEMKLSANDFKGIMCKSTYLKALKELEQNGFLRKAQLYPNFFGYIFVEGGDLEEKQYAEQIVVL